MRADLKEFLQNCTTCLEFDRKYNSSYQRMDTRAKFPMKILGADYFELKGKHYHIFIDYFTKFPWVVELKCQDASEAVKHLRSIMADFRAPEILVTDHDTQYLSAEFQQLLQHNNIKHKPAPASSQFQNGKCEHAIQTFKMCRTKADSDQTLDELLVDLA